MRLVGAHYESNGSDIFGKFCMRLVGWLIVEVVHFVEALDNSNGRFRISSRLTMRVMRSDIFGKFRMRLVGWLIMEVCILCRSS